MFVICESATIQYNLRQNMIWTPTVCVLLFLAIEHSDGYCYVNQGKQGRCMVEGVELNEGSSFKDTVKCEECHCRKGGLLGCCGYGIKAGVFAAPPGHRVVTGADGCSVKIVKDYSVYGYSRYPPRSRNGR